MMLGSVRVRGSARAAIRARGNVGAHARLIQTALFASQPYDLSVRIWPMTMPTRAQMTMHTAKQSWLREPGTGVSANGDVLSRREGTDVFLGDLAERLAVAETDRADVDDELQALQDGGDVPRGAPEDALHQVRVGLHGEHVRVELQEQPPEQEPGIARHHAHLE